MRYKLTLDADKGEERFAVTREIVIRQGDALSYELDIDVRQGGEEFDLRGYAVRLYATKPDGSAVIDGENLAVTDAQTGHLLYTVPPQLVDSVGTVAPCYLRITDAQNADEYSLSTDSFRLKVVKGVGVNLASGEYVPEIDGLLVDMDKQLSDFELAEEDRASGEEARETAEQNRAEAERLRQEAEIARLSNESSRTSAENSRAAAESSRVTAEQLRASAEAERAAEFAVFEAKAQEWVPRILVEGEYDPITRKPTLTAGEFCTVYMSPSADSADMNAYDEYMWVPDDSEAGGHFEKLGASSVDFPAATSEDVAGILDGTVTQGGAGITVTAMAALKAGFDDEYAAAEHDHAVADVTGLQGELDSLDARIAALPTASDVGDVAASVQSLSASHDADMADVAANYLKDVRGSATDLSYAALRALKPGCYLVPSTAANQPTSGQGDGNLMVGRVSGNRVWAVLAYNTGAVYSAYGYEHQGSAANFGWRRIDNAAVTLSSLGAAASSHNHSAANITSGTLAVGRGGSGLTASPSMLTNLDSTAAASVFAASPRPGVTGTLGLGNGGTGATTAANARTNLGVTLANLGVSTGANSYGRYLKVGATQICTASFGPLTVAKDAIGKRTVTWARAFSATPYVIVGMRAWTDNVTSGWCVNAYGNASTTGADIRLYNASNGERDMYAEVIAFGAA